MGEIYYKFGVRIKMIGLKRISALLIAIIMFLMPTAIQATERVPAAAFELIYGDANLDGKVSTADANNMLAYCNGSKALNAMQYINGDVNADNCVNTADVMLVMRYLVGLVEYLPYCPTTTVSGSSLSFINNTFPARGGRITFGESYPLRGIISSKYALKKVQIVITDSRQGSVEIDEKVIFGAGECVCYYNTQTAENAIDDAVKFAKLTTGEKNLKLICSNSVEENVVLYESTFKVGFTYEEVAGHVYNRGDDVSPTEARKVLSLLNRLDYTNDVGAKIISAGMGKLGESYGTMDCSRFVQLSVREAIDFGLPRTSVEQALFCKDNGYLVDFDERRAGDLVFMSRTYCDCGRYHEVHHVALYIGFADGTDYIVESTSSLDGVVIRRIWGLAAGTWVVDSIGRVRN